MVKEVAAFAADDGSVFSTHGEAARHDAECKLKALNVFQGPTILAIINNADAVYQAIGPLMNDPDLKVKDR